MARRGHGEGSIYQRSDGRWAASISLEGSKRNTMYGKTRKVVQEKSSTSASNAEACEANRLATEEPPRVTARLAYPSSGNRAFEGS